MAPRPLQRDCDLGLDRARSWGHAACCTRRRTNPHGLAARACPPSRVGLAHRLLDTLTERETGGAYAAPCRPRGTGARRDSTPASIPGRRLASPAVEREQRALLAGPPPLFQALSSRERELVLSHGRRRVLNRGQTLFSQGTPHEGIYLIESGRIRVFYNAPSGREITLAYWYPGNFVGGPDIFGPSVHLWSGVATNNSSVVQLPGKALRTLVMQIPALGIGLIQGLSFKGKCSSALVQMLGTRSVTDRLAHLLLHLVDAYGIKVPDGTLIAAA